MCQLNHAGLHTHINISSRHTAEREWFLWKGECSHFVRELAILRLCVNQFSLEKWAGILLIKEDTLLCKGLHHRLHVVGQSFPFGLLAYNKLPFKYLFFSLNGPYSQWHLRGTVGDIVWQSGAECSIFTSPLWQFSTSLPGFWPGNRKIMFLYDFLAHLAASVPLRWHCE